MPYDERPLPALQRKNQPVEDIQSPAEQHSPQPDGQRTPHSPEMSGEPEPLTEKVQREAGFPIEIYGERLVGGKSRVVKLAKGCTFSKGFISASALPVVFILVYLSAD